MIEKLVKPETSIFFVPVEELFDKIHDAHTEKGHPVRDIWQQNMQHINIYRSFYEKCGLKKIEARRHISYLRPWSEHFIPAGMK